MALDFTHVAQINQGLTLHHPRQPPYEHENLLLAATARNLLPVSSTSLKSRGSAIKSTHIMRQALVVTCRLSFKCFGEQERESV